MFKNALYGLNCIWKFKESNYIGAVNVTFCSEGYEKDGAAAVRPVVILNKNITKNQIQRIPDKTEETWN